MSHGPGVSPSFWGGSPLKGYVGGILFAGLSHLADRRNTIQLANSDQCGSWGGPVGQEDWLT